MPQQRLPDEPVFTAEQIADALGTMPDRVDALIDHGYLKSPFRCDFADLTLVERPSDEMIEWLRAMLAPMERRPYIPLNHAATCLRTSAESVRDLCVSNRVQLFFDPVFGELLSIESLRKLAGIFAKSRNPMGFDRQSLLDWVMLALKLGNKKPAPVIRRDERIMDEIMRISAMEEPARTIRAAEFWCAYRDARTIGECLRILNDSEETKNIMKIDQAFLKIDRAIKRGARGEWPGQRKVKFKIKEPSCGNKFMAQLDLEQRMQIIQAKRDASDAVYAVRKKLCEEAGIEVYPRKERLPLREAALKTTRRLSMPLPSRPGKDQQTP